MSVVESLELVLANSYALYLKTQNYHWNVEGPQFKVLHEMFEEQYTDLAAAIDTTAELIRGLGEKAPGDFETFSKKSSIKDGDSDASSEQMLKDLIEDQLTMEKILTTALKNAQKNNDEVVADFLIDRLTTHRKAAWMLKSSL